MPWGAHGAREIKRKWENVKEDVTDKRVSGRRPPLLRGASKATCHWSTELSEGMTLRNLWSFRPLRSQSLTMSTPWCEELDKNTFFSFQYFSVEIGVGEFYNIFTRWTSTAALYIAK